MSTGLQTNFFHQRQLASYMCYNSKEVKVLLFRSHCLHSHFRIYWEARPGGGGVTSLQAINHVIETKPMHSFFLRFSNWMSRGEVVGRWGEDEQGRSGINNWVATEVGYWGSWERLLTERRQEKGVCWTY